jgi:hypothetical protein
LSAIAQKAVKSMKVKRTIHEAFHVAIYIKLKPVLELDSSDVESAKHSTLLCRFAIKNKKKH